MTLDDGRKILTGGDTAATEYFKSKTSSQLFNAFKPDISQSMNEVGVTKAYITELQSAGYKDLPLDAVIRALAPAVMTITCASA